MDFEFRADPYVLYRLKERYGLDFSHVLEDCIKEAIAEFEHRLRMPENGFRRHMSFRRTKVATSDPIICQVGKKWSGPFLSSAFDVAVMRKVERRLVLCELRSSQS